MTKVTLAALKFVSQERILDARDYFDWASVVVPKDIGNVASKSGKVWHIMGDGHLYGVFPDRESAKAAIERAKELSK